jgi:hypothetical protein
VVLVEETWLERTFKHTAVMLAGVSIGQYRIHIDCAANSRRLKLLNHCSREPQRMIDRVGLCCNLSMRGICYDSEPSALTLVTCKSKYLRASENFDFSAMVVAYVYSTHVRREHTVGCNHHSVRAEEGNDDGGGISSMSAVLPTTDIRRVIARANG